MAEKYENNAVLFRLHGKNFFNFFQIPDLCKEVAKVGLLYSNHSQGENPRLDRKTQNLLKKIQKIFQKLINLQRTCKDHPDIIKPQ